MSQQGESVKPVKIDSSDPVKINELVIGNNRQTFLAKVFSVLSLPTIFDCTNTSTGS